VTRWSRGSLSHQVGYELLLRAVQEMGVADARLTLTALLVLPCRDRGAHRWMSRWVAQAVLAIELELRERAQAITPGSSRRQPRIHATGQESRDAGTQLEELAAATLLAVRRPRRRRRAVVRSLLDDVEVGLSTR
jgi:hypothetical protein